MSTPEPLDPAAIMTTHHPQSLIRESDPPECDGCRTACLYCEADHPWPCPTYRLAEALTAEHAARVAAEQELAEERRTLADSDRTLMMHWRKRHQAERERDALQERIDRALAAADAHDYVANYDQHAAALVLQDEMRRALTGADQPSEGVWDDEPGDHRYETDPCAECGAPADVHRAGCVSRGADQKPRVLDVTGLQPGADVRIPAEDDE